MDKTANCTLCDKLHPKKKLRNCLPVEEKLCPSCQSDFRTRKLFVYKSSAHLSFHPFPEGVKHTIAGFGKHKKRKNYTRPVLIPAGRLSSPKRSPKRSPERLRSLVESLHTPTPVLFEIDMDSPAASIGGSIENNELPLASSVAEQPLSIPCSNYDEDERIANAHLASSERVAFRLRVLAREKRSMEQRIEDISQKLEAEIKKRRVMEAELDELKRMETQITKLFSTRNRKKTSDE